MFTTSCLFGAETRVQMTKPLKVGDIESAESTKGVKNMSTVITSLLDALTTLIGFLGSVEG
ncbi:hypothetical protein CJ179_18825 [Rhodococcus sp. ACS1]|nr:hypothetical protein CJ179_18825 [Rhodococcus sp. ACS1]